MLMLSMNNHKLHCILLQLMQCCRQLHFAAANGRQNAVRFLVTKGASLEFPNWCGWTALMYASYYGHSEIVSYLIENKAQVNACNSRLVTPLICAARCGKTAVIEILLQNGAYIVPKVVEKTPTSQLSNKEPNMPTPVWRPPMTALMAAAQHGHHGICSMLMTYNAPIDYQNEANGYTALMLAAVNGHAKIVELLIQTGSADANIVNCRNQTAYVLSILRKRTDVENYLKSRTTRVTKEITTKSHQPPIIQAARTGNIQEVEKILRANPKPDLNVSSTDGVTPLIFASLNNHIDVVRLLLREDAKTDLQEENGWTALMHATIKRNVDIVKLLLRAGADTKIKNNKNLTVFDLATLAGLPQITRLFAPGALASQGKQPVNNDRDFKSSKSLLSKVTGKIKRGQQVNRVPVHDISLNPVEEHTPAHSEEVHKTSSIIQSFEASTQSLNGPTKPKLALAAPTYNLPDDVMAPVLPPCPTLKSFDIPKLPGVGAKQTGLGLNSSNGSNSGDNFNSSDESSSIKSFNRQNSSSSGIRRPQMQNNILYQQPDSPQSSMTSSGLSGFTSVSNYNGRGSMPNSGFKSPTNRPSLNFAKPNFPSQWQHQQPPPQHQAFSPAFQPPMPPYLRQGAKSPPLTLNDLSIRSVSSNSGDKNGDANISDFLQRLELEKYGAQFSEQEVDMIALREMDDNDLKDIGVDQTIYRKRIIDAVTPNQKHRGASNNRIPSHARFSPTPPGQPNALIPTAGFPKNQTSFASGMRGANGYPLIR
ncbi:ankyrin repeat and SAM domain-containing protein 6-like [Clytia hemisphaerica]|uniref:SAM domain-containing protein n=1 Tax=Clytia hemisphaerica TaxID=252671 RepID=A0A7M5TZ53_9CNID